MTVETEPEDAVPTPPWPGTVYDDSHPFGDVPLTVQLCARCAAMNEDSRMPIKVECNEHGYMYRTTIAAGSPRALLAAGWNALERKFRIKSVDGFLLHPLAITQVRGTLVCSAHLSEELKNTR